MSQTVFASFNVSNLYELKNELEYVHTRMRYYGETLNKDQVKELLNKVNDLESGQHDECLSEDTADQREHDARMDAYEDVQSKLENILDEYGSNKKELIKALNNLLGHIERAK